MCKIDERCVPHGYFGVFDGHGGVEVSEYAADRLHDNVLASPYMAQLDAHAALQDGLLRTDAELLRRAEQPQRRKTADAGSAAVCMLATADTLTLAHAGDCRAILVRRSNAPGAPFVELGATTPRSSTSRCATAACRCAPTRLIASGASAATTAVVTSASRPTSTRCR